MKVGDWQQHPLVLEGNQKPVSSCTGTLICEDKLLDSTADDQREVSGICGRTGNHKQ